MHQEVWLQWVQRLHGDVFPHTPTCGTCGGILAALLCALPLPCFACQLGRFHDAARAWLDAFNAEALQPLGMYASTQTAVYDESHGESHYHEELTWLAVATTPDEIEALKSEVHVWRFRHGCPCCNACCGGCCLCCGCPDEDMIVPEHSCVQTACCCCCAFQRMF